MSKSSVEIFNNKVNLIYEYNKQSPIFVRMANNEIEINNIDKAIEILKQGLILYPNYATAYFVLSKANILIGQYSEAKKALDKGSELIHNSRTKEFYLKELENIRKQRSLFETRTKNPFLPSEEETFKKEPDLFNENTENNDEETYSANEDKSLEQLAREISSARITSNEAEDEKDFSEEDFNEDNMIVSETLAKIYIAQGELIEAKNIYNKLISKNPDLKDYYLNRISEIDSKLES